MGGMRAAVISWLLVLLSGGAFAQGRKPKLGKNNELAIYLGCGEAAGPGTIVQLDASGKVLATLALPSTPYGMAAAKDGLVVAFPSHPRAVVKIDAEGKLHSG